MFVTVRLSPQQSRVMYATIMKTNYSRQTIALLGLVEIAKWREINHDFKPQLKYRNEGSSADVWTLTVMVPGELMSSLMASLHENRSQIIRRGIYLAAEKLGAWTNPKNLSQVSAPAPAMTPVAVPAAPQPEEASCEGEWEWQDEEPETEKPQLPEFDGI